jgi:glycosyltransferase involved in cell wall biosynthesis
MSNKNILIITSSIQPIFRTAEHLATSNKVHIVYLFPGPILNKIITGDYSKNIILYEINSNGANSLTEKRDNIFSLKILWPMLRMLKVSREILLTKDIDVIYPQWAIPSGFFACLLNNMLTLSKIKKKPIIITLRGSDIKIFFKNKLMKPLITYSLKNADIIISLTNDIKNDIIEDNIDSRKIFVIPNGTDRTVFKPLNQNKIKEEFKLPEDSFIALYVGSLIKLKNVDLLIKTVQSINDVNLYFIIIGSGPEKEHLQDLTKNNNLKNIIFVGQKEHSEIPGYMSSADILLLYSDSEGLPTVIQEALACGKPVISNSVGGVSEIVEDNVNGFLVNDPNEMKQKIEILIKNRELLDKMSKNALITSKKYDITTIHYEIDQLLNSF